MVKKLTEEEINEIKEEVNKEESKKEIIKKEKYELVEVPTQTSIVIREVGTDNLLDDKAILLIILNKLSTIEKAVA